MQTGTNLKMNLLILKTEDVEVDDDDEEKVIACSTNSDCPQDYNCYYEKCYSKDKFIFMLRVPGNDPFFRLPLVKNGNYNFIVDWGDGLKVRITDYDTLGVGHGYESDEYGKNYLVTITGIIEGWQFCNYIDSTEECDENDSD